jgi:hypothetical protein
MKPGLLFAMLSVALSAETLTQPPPLIRILQSTAPEPAPLTANPAAGVFLFAMATLTGQPESWLLETHTSFAGLEEFDAAQPRSPIPDARTLIAFHRQWWSHRPDEAVQALRKARYIQVSMYRTGISNDAEFAELLRARKASLDSINLDRPDMVYQVIAGAPSGTYIVLSPLTSLKVLDDGVSRSAAAYLRSTGTPSSRTTAAVRPGSELSHENMIFRLDPARSHVSPEFAESDPGYWRAK